MIKEINGYKVRVSSKEGMKYIKVSKENRISQEFIPNFMKEKEIKELNMGGGSVEQPSTPPAPSGAEAVEAWAEQLPNIYQTQLQYEPLMLQQQLDMQQQFAEPLMESYLKLQQSRKLSLDL